MNDERNKLFDDTLNWVELGWVECARASNFEVYCGFFWVDGDA
jgi:hypothetical protein